MIILNAVTDFFFKGEFLDNIVANVTFTVCCVALTLSVIFFIGTLAWNYAVSTVKRIGDGKAEKFLDKEEMIRTIFLMMCIVIYMPVVWFVIDSCEVICRTIVPSEQIALVTEQTLQKLIEESGAYGDVPEEAKNLIAVYDDPSSTTEEKEQAKEYLKSQFNIDVTAPDPLEEAIPNEPTSNFKILSAILGILNPATWVRMAFGALVTILLFLIRMVISFFTVNLVRVLVCIGPMALAFSIIPAFRNQINVWFGTLLTACMVFFTMNILEALIYSSMFNFTDIMDGPLEITNNTIAVMAMQVTIIILYTMSFWLTGKYVGKGDAGRVITKAISIATIATMAALSAGGGAIAGGGAASSAGSGVKDAAATARETFGNDES